MMTNCCLVSDEQARQIHEVRSVLKALNKGLVGLSLARKSSPGGSPRRAVPPVLCTDCSYLLGSLSLSLSLHFFFFFLFWGTLPQAWVRPTALQPAQDVIRSLARPLSTSQDPHSKKKKKKERERESFNDFCVAFGCLFWISLAFVSR